MHIGLKSLHLKNFRGYKDALITFNDRMNVIIGKNDVGKSTILEALEIFFNSEQIKIEPIDRNVCCSPDEKIEMTCCFTLDESAKTVVDASVPVRMDQEYLLNPDGQLEILKTWDCSKKSIGSKDIKTYIVANYPNISDKPIICEKISSLKMILKGCVSAEEYDVVDKTKASEIRQAIYSKKITEQTVFTPIEIDITQEGTKNIWASLLQSLPLFFLFKSDRLNSDKDSEVQTPMKAVTKTVISQMQSSIDAIVDNVTEQLTRIGLDTIEKLSDLDPQIATKLSPKVIVKPFDSVFSFELLSDDGIPLSRRGSGIRRLILLSYFRAEAEKKVGNSHNSSIIYAIEEPETAQHPDYQKMIIETLQDLANDDRHQIILTTHTPEIAKLVDLQQLIFLYKDESGAPCIETKDDVKYQSIARTLGILPFAAEQCVICVEGENDVNFLNAINKIPEFNKIIDFESQRIRIIPLYGSSLIRWVNSNYFAESNIKEIHFYDNDREDYRKIAEKINVSPDNRRVAWLTQRPEMENYIPPKIIEKDYGIDLSRHYDTWAQADVPEILASKIMLQVKDANERKKNIKILLNKRTSTHITADSLKEINVFEELETLFKKISAFVDGTYIEKTNLHQ